MKEKFYISLLSVILVIVTFSCSQSTSVNPTNGFLTSTFTKVSIPTKIPTRISILTATKAPTSILKPTIPPSPTKIIQSFNLQWTIETGELVLLGVAENGKIYGLMADGRHVTISSGGKVENITPLPKPAGDCAYQFTITTGKGNDERVRVLPDGNIVCRVNRGIQIKPDGQVIETTEGWLNIGYTFFPYATDGTYLKNVTLPDGKGPGSENHRYWLEYPIVLTQNEFTFPNNNGKLISTAFPVDFDLKRGYQYTVTPWGDLYLFYSAYDALGNRTGNKIFRVSADGTTSRLTKDPIAPWTFANCSYCRLDQNIYYLSNKDRIYFINPDALFELDRDFNIKASYKLGFRAELGNYETFLGNDGAIYQWVNRKLSKYILISIQF